VKENTSEYFKEESMAKSPHISRNEFVKIVVGAVGTLIGAVIALPAVGYLIKPAVDSMRANTGDSWIPAGPLDNFEIGKPELFSFTRSKVNGWERTTTSYGVYILRQNETETKAMSNICTHLSCRVTFSEERQEYLCPCHDAQFTIDGQIVRGPQPRPMDEFPTKVENGTLFFNYLEG
jgi:menaquinol-cytochrome c reductase iron-sulfur subunit